MTVMVFWTGTGVEGSTKDLSKCSRTGPSIAVSTVIVPARRLVELEFQLHA